MVYTKRLQQLEHQYDDQAVLDVFPLCLKGEACDLYTHLSNGVTDRMRCSMAECILRVQRRFKKDILEARIAHPNIIIFSLSLLTDLQLMRQLRSVHASFFSSLPKY
jgi:hypothetical protein